MQCVATFCYGSDDKIAAEIIVDLRTVESIPFKARWDVGCFVPDPLLVLNIEVVFEEAQTSSHQVFKALFVREEPLQRFSVSDDCEAL